MFNRKLIYTQNSDGQGLYLTFTGTQPFTLSVKGKYWDGIVEYSIDTINWTVWDGTEINSGTGNNLYLRGYNNTTFASSNTSYTNFIFPTSVQIAVNGNIENLLDYKKVANGEHPVMADYCYYYMFYGCTSLTKAPSLPATTLASSCYYYMFHSCTSLTQAPSLPATILADYCYEYMFRGCTSLTQAPSLPATTLANSCYESMFWDCTSLTQAPSLPATILADNCYRYMFKDCTSLTQVPSLPATTLARACYQYMFLDSSIKFSATKTGEYQYALRIPKSGTATISSGNVGPIDGSLTPSLNTTYYVNKPVV